VTLQLALTRWCFFLSFLKALLVDRLNVVPYSFNPTTTCLIMRVQTILSYALVACTTSVYAAPYGFGKSNIVALARKPFLASGQSLEE
jgi:hypothetical protein